jgi:predicted transcriptional regulator of viral defense system
MSNKNLLFQIADSQQGYFTSQQAEESGFPRSNFHRYLQSGEWIKELRGIYRLAHYPVTDRPELVLWSLWSRNRQGEVQGAWSYETALDIYELSDVMPAKMHMTVPKYYRKGTKIPQGLVLYFEDLPKSDVQTQQGYFVTTPLRTILDIVEKSHLSSDLIIQAIREGLKKGLLSYKELKDTQSVKIMEFLDEYKL